MSIEKTAFISYRRTNEYMARSVFLDLVHHGYDVFLDYESLDSGAFSKIILNQIEARAHFIVILTPSALARCVSNDDWLRIEIEHAIRTRRNVVPLMFENFSFDDNQQFLVGDQLSLLKEYNALAVPRGYFDEAMSKLRTHFINKPLNVIVHPAAKSETTRRDQIQHQIIPIPQPSNAQLTAEASFERGYHKCRIQQDSRSAIPEFDTAIKLNPMLAEAYYYRGVSYSNIGETENAISDWEQAAKLLPNDRLVNLIWGRIYQAQKRLDKALQEAETAVKKNPDYDEAIFFERS